VVKVWLFFFNSPNASGGPWHFRGQSKAQKRCLGLGTSFDMEHMMILNGGANMGFYSGGYLFFLCGSSNKNLEG
jgi:hypothetical protein